MPSFAIAADASVKHRKNSYMKL